MIAVMAAVSAFFVALIFTRSICRPNSMLHVLDHPNERSLHTHPVPRTGGVAILAGVLVGSIIFEVGSALPHVAQWLLGGAALVGLLSFMDDRKDLSVHVRLVGQLACVLLLLIGGGLYPRELVWPEGVWDWPEWLGLLFGGLFLMWMVNLYNFMDGMDGFAGGMAVIGFGTLAVFGGIGDNLPYFTFNLVVAGSAFGFLFFNFPPARIFMGDSGSATLGFLAGGSSVWGAQANIFPFWIALLVFSPFVIDATTTLLRRAAHGERIWEAHRSHYYQRLVRSGWGHRKTVVAEYGLMLACSASAIFAAHAVAKEQWVVILAWCVIYVGLARNIPK